MLDILDELDIYDLFRVCVSVFKENSESIAELRLKLNIGIKKVNGTPTIDKEYFKSFKKEKKKEAEDFLWGEKKDSY